MLKNNNLKSFLKHHAIYLFVYLLLLVYLGFFLWCQSKVQIHRSMNAYVGNVYIDTFFKYVTHLGDGLFAFLIATIFLFISVRKSLYILVSYLGAAIVSSFLKHVIYEEVARPSFVFQYFVRENLKEVEGVELAGLHSFPSGHALSAFALFFCLLFLNKHHFFKTVFFLLAVLAAYSRVYLSQHWLVDVYAGSIIGVTFALVFYALFYAKPKWPQLNTTLPKLLFNNNAKRA